MLRRLISTHNLDKIDIRCYNCDKIETVSGKKDLPGDWAFMYYAVDGSLQTVYKAWTWIYQSLDNLFCSPKCFEERYNIGTD